jgi:hypothetical protein
MSCSSPYFWRSNAEDLYYFFNNKTLVAAPCHTCSFPKPFRKESNHLIIYPFSINPSVKMSACSRQETELASKQCVHALKCKNLIPSCCCCFPTGKKTPCPAAVVDLAKISTDVFIIQLG